MALYKALMAEWSKALVLGTSLFVDAGSNPVQCKVLSDLNDTLIDFSNFLFFLTFNQNDPGSIPGIGEFKVPYAWC